MTLPSATPVGLSGPGANGMEGYSTFPKAPTLQEHDHYIV